MTPAPMTTIHSVFMGAPSRAARHPSERLPRDFGPAPRAALRTDRDRGARRGVGDASVGTLRASAIDGQSVAGGHGRARPGCGARAASGARTVGARGPRRALTLDRGRGARSRAQVPQPHGGRAERASGGGRAGERPSIADVPARHQHHCASPNAAMRTGTRGAIAPPPAGGDNQEGRSDGTWPSKRAVERPPQRRPQTGPPLIFAPAGRRAAGRVPAAAAGVRSARFAR